MMHQQQQKKRPVKPGHHAKAEVPEAQPFFPPVFRATDQLAEGKAYLEQHGYACYGPILTSEEIETAISYLWDFLEELGTGINRANPATWKTENWLPDGGKGILYTNHVGQSRFMWYLRENPHIANIFASIWNCQVDDLLTSFDGCCIMRPVSFNYEWKTASGWYHIDQNGINKPDLACYQGLVNLLDAGKDAPGLVVCPGSHHRFRAFFEQNPGAGHAGSIMKGDFITVKPAQLTSFFNVHPIKICAPAGTFIVWDSRTIHCNTPAANNKFSVQKENNADGVVIPDRIVGYVCMSPRPAVHHVLMNLLKQKRKAVREGVTTNHWPDEFHPSREPPARMGSQTPITAEYKDITPTLSERARRLAGIDG